MTNLHFLLCEKHGHNFQVVACYPEADEALLRCSRCEIECTDRFNPSGLVERIWHQSFVAYCETIKSLIRMQDDLRPKCTGCNRPLHDYRVAACDPCERELRDHVASLTAMRDALR